ncbi:mannan-binding lectin [Kistimonas asteriae]|uniref:mannan-binding lectin n=1 Tax=Kistimonas asteriae TaxID=517724 RepID=UPI001BA6659A|nr:mannan-binding lectin [Kistimonas asteriae]
MNSFKQWIKQSLLICTLISTGANGSPPKIQNSATDVKISVDSSGNRYYFAAGKYGYYGLWDYGPVEMIVHSLHAYDTEGNRVLSSPPIIREGGFIGYIHPMADAELRFEGQGTARYATTTKSIWIPKEFYENENIAHVSAEFSVVDGRMSLGPLWPMLTDWGNESSVQPYVELLLWSRTKVKRELQIITTLHNDPVWNSHEAQSSCALRCYKEGALWTGRWWTTEVDQQSACECQKYLLAPE